MFLLILLFLMRVVRVSLVVGESSVRFFSTDLSSLFLGKASEKKFLLFCIRWSGRSMNRFLICMFLEEV